MEWLVLGLFVGLLFLSVGFGLPLPAALLGGYVLFFLYGLIRKHTPAALWRMSVQGLKTVGNILFLFVLIGMITALWRACGTIPFLIYYASSLISPAVFFLLAFLLNCMVSYLTGTSFGTAATMGVICMSIATAMGLHPVLAAGSILSGVFFGDRCSPMSTSALLVAAITRTDLFRNLSLMMRTAAAPFVLTCAVCLCFGLRHGSGEFSREILEPFARGYCLHWTTLLPAAVIVILSLFQCNVKLTMGLSILCSAILWTVLQGGEVAQLGRLLLLGYTPELPEIRGLLSGGGVVSMAKPLCIVSISSTFSGLFEGTGLLDGMKRQTARLSRRLTPFGGLLTVSVGASLVACNQSLAILLTDALCRDEQPPQALAVGLENTVVVIAPLVPWSIAGAVPAASLGAPFLSYAAACYLYLIPLWNLLVSFRRGSEKEKGHQGQGYGAKNGAEEVDLGGELVVRAEPNAQNGDHGAAGTGGD